MITNKTLMHYWISRANSNANKGVRLVLFRPAHAQFNFKIFTTRKTSKCLLFKPPLPPPPLPTPPPPSQPPHPHPHPQKYMVDTSLVPDLRVCNTFWSCEFKVPRVSHQGDVRVCVDVVLRYFWCGFLQLLLTPVCGFGEFDDFCCFFPCTMYAVSAHPLPRPISM